MSIPLECIAILKKCDFSAYPTVSKVSLSFVSLPLADLNFSNDVSFLAKIQFFWGLPITLLRKKAAKGKRQI